MALITSLTLSIVSAYNPAGVTAAQASMATLNSKLDDQNKAWGNLTEGVDLFGSAIIGLGPALVPIGAGLLGIGAAAGTAFIGAGAAVGIFGGVMETAISEVIGAKSAVTTTGNALDAAQVKLSTMTAGTKAYGAEETKVIALEKQHQAAIAGLTPVQQQFAVSIDTMKGAWQDLVTSTMSYTLGPATTMVQAATDAIPKLRSVIVDLAPVVQSIATATKNWVTGGGLDTFLAFVKSVGIPVLYDLEAAGRALFGALGDGMRATAPLGVDFGSWVKDVAEDFQKWASGGGFSDFMTYLKQNGPALIQSAKSLGDSLLNLFKAAKNMSGLSLSAVVILLNLIAKLNPSLIQDLAYAYLAWNAALLAFNLYGAIAATVSFALALATSPLLILFAGMALTVLVVVAALVALGVGIYFLVSYWSTVWGAIKDAASAVWGWLQSAWAATWNAIKGTAVDVWNFLTQGMGQLLLILMGPVGVLIFVAAHWSAIWGTIKQVASDVWGWMQSAWSDTVGGLSDAYHGVMDPVFKSWDTVWPQAKLAAQDVWQSLQQLWQDLWTFFTDIWNDFWSVWGTDFTTGWTDVSTSAQAVWTALQDAWQAVWAVIQAVWTVFVSVLTAEWKVFWALISAVAQLAWSVLSGAWSILWSVVTGIWNVFYATFSAIFKAAWSVVVSIATGVWSVISAAWSALWAVVTAIFTTFFAIFTGNWGVAWNAIKAAGQAIWNVMSAAWQAFTDVLLTIYNGFMSVFSAFFSSSWNAIKAVGQAIWTAISSVFQTFLTGVETVWNTAWNAVKAAGTAIWGALETAAAAVWTAIKAAFSAFLSVLETAWSTAWNLIKTAATAVWSALQTAAGALWTALQAVFNAGLNFFLTTFWNPLSTFFTKTIPSAFTAGVNAIGAAWNSIKNIVRAPIQAIVDVVYNEGIVALWNDVAGVFGASKLQPFVLPAFAAGGPVSGPGTATSDSVMAALSNGEHVWTAAEVAAAGGHNAVAALRSAVMGGAPVRTLGDAAGNYASGGGVLGTITGVVKGIGGAISSAADALKNVVLGGVADVIDPALNAMLKGAIGTINAVTPSGDLQTLADAIPTKMVSTIESWVKGKDVAPAGSGGGPVGTGSSVTALAWARTQNGKPYQWGGNGNPSWDCCITGPVRIYGPHGATPIKDVAAGDEVFSYVDGKVTVQTVTAAWQSETQQVYRVRTRNRIVTASANHPFMKLVEVEPARRIRGGRRGEQSPARYGVEWARLDELERGDLLVQPREMRPDSVDDARLPDGTPVTDDVAWLLGLFIGDGYLTDNTIRICVYGDDSVRAQQVFASLGINSFTSAKHGVVASSVSLVRMLEGMGLRVPGPEKRVPDAVWTWVAELRQAFLNGYCDADGHHPQNPAKHGERTYASASRELLEDVRALHIMMGQPVSNVSTNHRTKPITIKCVRVRNALPLHSFTVWPGTGRGEAALRRLPGVAAWMDAGDFTVTRVLEVSCEGIQDTYDLEVEGAHNFIADGVVVHNSGFMSAIESVIQGMQPHRQWATMSFDGATAAPGWVENAKAPFMIGVTSAGVGHTAGTLNGVNVESAAGGIHVGSGARGWNDPLFMWHYGFDPTAKYAAGTTYARPGMSIVGELGPELMQTRGGESIMSNADLRNALSGGGGDVTVNMPVTITGNATPETMDHLGRTVVPQLRLALKQGVGRKP